MKVTEGTRTGKRGHDFANLYYYHLTLLYSEHILHNVYKVCSYLPENMRKINNIYGIAVWYRKGLADKPWW